MSSNNAIIVRKEANGTITVSDICVDSEFSDSGCLLATYKEDQILDVIREIQSGKWLSEYGIYFEGF